MRPRFPRWPNLPNLHYVTVCFINAVPDFLSGHVAFVTDYHLVDSTRFTPKFTKHKPFLFRSVIVV